MGETEPEDGMIIRGVDFGSKKMIHGAPVAVEREDLFAGFSTRARDLLAKFDSGEAVGRFVTFLKSLRGFVIGKTYKDALFENQKLPRHELLEILQKGESLWKVRPQFYAAIYQLIAKGINREIDES